MSLAPVVLTAAALFHTQGGLRVDKSARVLRPGGVAIEGLYAAGGTAAGISGHGAAGYIAGNGLTSAAALGYRVYRGG
jgi:fumarate reductase flavoprotein subunit